MKSSCTNFRGPQYQFRSYLHIFSVPTGNSDTRIRYFETLSFGISLHTLRNTKYARYVHEQNSRKFFPFCQKLSIRTQRTTFVGQAGLWFEIAEVKKVAITTDKRSLLAFCISPFTTRATPLLPSSFKVMAFSIITSSFTDWSSSSILLLLFVPANCAMLHTPDILELF